MTVRAYLDHLAARNLRNKVGLQVAIPDRTRGTAEQWGAVADAAVAELDAAKTIPQKAARRQLLSRWSRKRTPNRKRAMTSARHATTPIPRT